MVCVTNILEFYSTLRKSAKRSGPNTLHIFVGGIYADSLCALKVLRDCLKSESIRYSVFFIYGLKDLERHSREKGMQNSSEPYTAILLNCGANKNLKQYLQLGSQACLFIIDCHQGRPSGNLHPANRQVLVLRLDEQAGEEVEEALQRGWDGEAAEEEGPHDEDDGVDEEGRRRNWKRRRTGEGGEKQQQFHSFGKPSGIVLYKLAHQHHKGTSELLWYACISLTDHMIHGRLSQEDYGNEYEELHLATLTLGDAPPSASMENGVEVRVPDMYRIVCEQQLNLMCLPRWRLFDSLRYSTYTCTRLVTWREQGLKKLKLLLAQLGIRICDAEQKFGHMDSRLLKRIQDEVAMLGQQYKLTDLYFRGFKLHHGYKTKMSAADLVFGVTALIDRGRDMDDLQSNCWLAARALSTSGWSSLDEGLDRAILIQKACVERCKLDIARKAPKAKFRPGGRLQDFRYKLWQLGPEADPLLFAFPQTLKRLGFLYMAALKNSDKEEERKGAMVPMLISLEKKHSGTHLVVGVSLKSSLKSFANVFWRGFERAIRHPDLQPHVVQHNAEVGFCEVLSSHVADFLSNFHTLCN